MSKEDTINVGQAGPEIDKAGVDLAGAEPDLRQVARILARMAVQRYLHLREMKSDKRKSPSADSG